MPQYATGRKEGERPYEPATIDYMMAVPEKMSEAMESCHGVPIVLVNHVTSLDMQLEVLPKTMLMTI